MEISGTSFRLLKYLNTYKNRELIRETELIVPLKIKQRDELANSVYELQTKGLIGGGKGNVHYKPEGEVYYNNIVKKNNELIYNDAFENYDYAILKFLHFNSWGVQSEEFPSILKDRCPINLFDDYLYQQWSKIKNDNGRYFLKPEGEQHYYLRTERKKNAGKQNSDEINLDVIIAVNSPLDNIKMNTNNKINHGTITNSAKKSDWLEKLSWISSIIGAALGFKK